MSKMFMDNLIKLEFKDEKLNSDRLAKNWLDETEIKLNETYEDIISKAWMDLSIYGHSALLIEEDKISVVDISKWRKIEDDI